MTVAVPTDPLYTGTNVTLTCNIVLNDLVDSPVIVNVAWTGPGGEISSSSRVMLLGVTESSSPFQATLTFAPLISSDGGDYTCEATVIPDDGEFITMSLPGSGTGTVAVQGTSDFHESHDTMPYGSLFHFLHRPTHSTSGNHS